MTEVNVTQILNTIKGLNSMSALPVEAFAEEGGYADTLATFFVEKDSKERKERLKPTQLRKVFHALKRIDVQLKGKSDEETFNRAEILRYLPELAYARGRDLIPDEFYNLMRECLDQRRLRTVGDFRRVMGFLEAILAFHKFRKETKQTRREA